jgi:Cdc6-like AAA superfamily ATPase
VDGAIVVFVTLSSILADRLEPELLAIHLVPDAVRLVLEAVDDRGGDVEIALEPLREVQKLEQEHGSPLFRRPQRLAALPAVSGGG